MSEPSTTRIQDSKSSKNKMSEYEMKRLQNLKDNAEFLASLGINQIKATVHDVQKPERVPVKKKPPPPPRISSLRLQRITPTGERLPPPPPPPPEPEEKPVIFKCSVAGCLARFGTIFNLDSHRRGVHGPRMQCPKNCGYTCSVTRTNDMRLHVYRMHIKKKEKKKRSRQNQTKGKTQRSLTTLANVSRFECKFSGCGKQYTTLASLTQHTKDCHRPRVKCPRKCGYSCPLDRKRYMKRHMETKHGVSFENDGFTLYGYLPQQSPLTTPATVSGSSSRTTATSTLSMPLITSSATTSHTSLGVMVTEPPAAALAMPPTSICSTNSNHNTCSNAVGPFLPACSTAATLPSSVVAWVGVLPDASASSVSMPSEEVVGRTDNVRGRAVALLKMGGMPLFPPARRDWDSVEEESVKLTETLSWPPRGWTNFSIEQKVTASEFAMYSLLSHTGQIIGQSKSYIFDMFNFMKLPGCGKCKSEREDSVESKMRLYNLLKLKQIAVCKDKEGSLEIVQMHEKSVAGYRSTVADQFLEIIKDVPLRLS